MKFRVQYSLFLTDIAPVLSYFDILNLCHLVAALALGDQSDAPCRGYWGLELLS